MEEQKGEEEKCQIEIQQLQEQIDELKNERKLLEERVDQSTREVKEDIQFVEELASKIKLTEQQIELFTQESRAAEERVNQANSEFTQEVCTNVRAIRAPSKNLRGLANKFLLMLGQKECSWKRFQILSKNYNSLQTQMKSMETERISGEKLEELLPLWKESRPLSTILHNEARGSEIILKWITGLVEFTLKKEALESTRGVQCELQDRVRNFLQQIMDKNVTLSKLQTRLREVALLDSKLRREIDKKRILLSLHITLEQTKEDSKIVLHDYLSEPVISFSGGRKPGPKAEAGSLIQTGSQANPPQIELSHPASLPQLAADEIIDEQGNSIKLESSEPTLCCCSSKVKNYFCG